MRGFTWSFSKLKNFQTCPKRHYEVDLAKNFIESSENLTWGNTVHDALAKACTGAAPLPATMSEYQKWVNTALKAKAAGWEVRTEQKYALTRDLLPCPYFDKDRSKPLVWYRGIGDILLLLPPFAMIWDWKTGKPNTDSNQLMLMAQCVMSHHLDINVVDTAFIWLQHQCSSEERYTREQLRDEWVGLLPRVGAMEEAARTQSYPPKPNRFCGRWCPVTSCPHHGKSY